MTINNSLYEELFKMATSIMEKAYAPYSKFKVGCEKILNSYNSDSFTTTTIRPSTVCGYATRQRLDLVVNILTNHAYHNNKIKVYGGKQLRPNIHINDMVRSYIKVIESDEKLINKEIFSPPAMPLG